MYDIYLLTYIYLTYWMKFKQFWLTMAVLLPCLGTTFGVESRAIMDMAVIPR